MKLLPPKKVYVSESKIHGLGVFASEKIYKGEIIEECPLLDLKIPKGTNTDLMIDYRFNWPRSVNPELQVLPWGYGCIYNHSETPNASWMCNYTNFTFYFYALREIQTDEEICTYYGNSVYWQMGRQHTIIK